MGIQLVDYYLADEKKPTYYIFLYDGDYKPWLYDRPRTPFQIFKADSWKEARNFAAAFVSRSHNQWMAVSALSPKYATNSAIEVAHQDFWRDNSGFVNYTSQNIPAGVIKHYSEQIRNEPIAQENDDSELRKRMDEVKHLMDSAKPGETLADVIARRAYAQRQKEADEKARHMWRHGDWSPEQERLFPMGEQKPEELAKTRPKGETYLDEFKEPEKEENWTWAKYWVRLMRKKDDQPNIMGSQFVKGGGGYETLEEAEKGLERMYLSIHDRHREKWDYAALKELDMKTGEEIRTIKTMGRGAGKEIQSDLREAHEREPSNLNERMKRIPGVVDAHYNSEDLSLAIYYDASYDINTLKFRVPEAIARANLIRAVEKINYYSQPPEAHEKEPRSRDTIGGSELVWRAFQNYLKEQTGENFDKLDLSVIKENYADFTIEGAREHAEKDPLIAPHFSAESQLDELEADPAYSQLTADIEALRDAGYSDEKIINILIKQAGLSRLGRPGLAELERAKDELKAERQRAEGLERQMLEERSAKVAGQPPPKPKAPPLNYTPEQVDLLTSYFNTEFQRCCKREANAQEMNRFNEFIDNIQKIKPPVRFPLLKSQVEDIAKALRALQAGANIPAKREKIRLSELLEKMLRAPLSPQEEEEVLRLEGELEEEDTGMPLGMMEPQYERPHIRVIADAGPENVRFLLGTPIHPDKPFPRELMRTWERDNAEINAENFRKKGYTIHIEEF